MAKRAKNMRYLIAHKRSCSPQGTLIWGILSALAILLVSSCKAPKGHSQPQNAPRPQKISAIAMAHHSMKISGSMRKASQEKIGRASCRERVEVAEVDGGVEREVIEE